MEFCNRIGQVKVFTNLRDFSSLGIRCDFLLVIFLTSNFRVFHFVFRLIFGILLFTIVFLGKWIRFLLLIIFFFVLCFIKVIGILFTVLLNEVFLRHLFGIVNHLAFNFTFFKVNVFLLERINTLLRFSILGRFITTVNCIIRCRTFLVQELIRRINITIVIDVFVFTVFKFFIVCLIVYRVEFLLLRKSPTFCKVFFLFRLIDYDGLTTFSNHRVFLWVFHLTCFIYCYLRSHNGRYCFHQSFHVFSSHHCSPLHPH